MRLNIRLIGVLLRHPHARDVGRKVLELGRGRDKNAGAIFVAAADRDGRSVTSACSSDD
jgi:hypothetical protein